MKRFCYKKSLNHFVVIFKLKNMMSQFNFFPLIGFLCLGILVLSCEKQVKIDDIENPPTISNDDKAFTNVFKKLDGTWKGNFIVIKDGDPLLATSIDLENLKLDYVTKPGLTLMNNIEVTQKYTSESPYFQRVQIYDFYPKDKKTVPSVGVNKIQDGKMWCVVKKPNETIIHEGSVRDENTIIWQSRQENPQRIEYFQETVTDTEYEIIGYGYYQGHRTDLGPQTWYYGKYIKE